ncbi:MAG: nucleoside/nucleotide kinase family protein [Cryobacterium sp.]|nr:nucleoside/nucleotide kinase family protein [Cryobacterium sp.]
MVGSANARAITDLVETMRKRAESSPLRQIIGIVGAPGTGKSTFAARVRDEFAPSACIIVPMDGFHLANNILDGTPLRARKGAIDTFDARGYISLLRRLRAQDEDVVYAPAYRRGLEEPIAGSIAVPHATQFILTEGNYLLADCEPWNQVRDYLDLAWFVETPHVLRLSRIVDRHVRFGMERSVAEAWASGPDQDNARFVESTKLRADRLVQWE